MTRAKLPLILIPVGLGLAYWALHAKPAPLDREEFEKSLRTSARRGLRTDAQCETFFVEWDGLWAKGKPLGRSEIQKLANHLRQYPGVSRETREAWGLLASDQPFDKGADVSFAFGLSDCQYSRFLLACRTVASTASQLKLSPEEGRDLSSAILGVIRELLETPVSRQVLFGSAQLMRELQTRQWLEWEREDIAEVDLILKALKASNQVADVKDISLRDKVFQAASFRDVAEADRREIATELGRSYSECEKLRQRFLPLLRRVRLPSS